MGKKDETALAPAKAKAGEGEETVEELLCRVAALVDDVEEPDGEPTAREVEEARAAVERRVEEVDGEIGELEERADRLDGLAERLEVGMEARFRGTLEGFDSRRMYCGYCGQGVRKGDVEGASEVVEGRLSEVEQELEGLRAQRRKFVGVRSGLKRY